MEEKKLVIYIAGPYTGDSAKEISENVQNAERVGQEILRRGHVALCPHSMTHDWDIGTGLGYQVFIDSDLVLLERCDAICMVHGYGRSKGSMGELKRAEELDLQIFLSIDQVPLGPGAVDPFGDGLPPAVDIPGGPYLPRTY